jgi:hypothetical protein
MISLFIQLMVLVLPVEKHAKRNGGHFRQPKENQLRIKPTQQRKLYAAVLDGLTAPPNISE